jgi:hypothetical protein
MELSLEEEGSIESIFLAFPISSLSTTDNFYRINSLPFMDSPMIMRHLESVHIFADPSGLGSYCMQSGHFDFAGQLTRLAVLKLQLLPKDIQNSRMVPRVPVVDMDDLSAFDENTSVLSRFSTSGSTPRAGLVLSIPKYGGEVARTLSNKLSYQGIPSNPLPFTGNPTAHSQLIPCTGRKSSKDMATLVSLKGAHAFPLHFL